MEKLNRSSFLNLISDFLLLVSSGYLNVRSFLRGDSLLIPKILLADGIFFSLCWLVTVLNIMEFSCSPLRVYLSPGR